MLGVVIQFMGIGASSILTIGTVIWCVAYADSHWGIIGGVLGLMFCPLAAFVLPIHCGIHEGRWIPALIVFIGIPVTMAIAGPGTWIRESTSN